MKKHIPNFITLLNLLCGAISLTLIAQGDYLTAILFGAASQVFDFLDGMAARVLKAYSAIGKQLDSLADVISFGLVPSFMIYRLLTDAGAQGIASYLAFLLLLAAAWRLAVFNIDEGQTRTFRGLPTPAAAIMAMWVPLLSYSGNTIISDLAASTPFLLTLSVALSYLMVSEIKLFSLKISSFSFRGNIHRYLLLFLLLALLILHWPLAGILVIPLYILLSLIFSERVRADEQGKS